MSDFSPEDFLTRAEEEVMAAIARNEYVASVTLAGYKKVTAMNNYFRETEGVDDLAAWCLWLRKLLAVDERYYALPNAIAYEAREYQYVIIFCW